MERVQGATMAIYTAFFGTAGMPMIKRKKAWIERWYSESKQEREDLRDRQFVKLFRFAYRYVPFYHSLYRKAGVNPGTIRGIDDIGKLPYADKDDLKRANHRDLKPMFPKSRFLVESSTSGSSGVPFVMYRSIGALTLYGAQLLGYLERWGLPGGRKVFFILYNADPTTLLQLPYSKPFSVFNRSHSVNPEAGSAIMAARLVQEMPDAVIAHPSTVEDIVDHLDELGIHPEYPVTFATGGEMLTDRLRKKVSTTFPSSRMFDIYNSVETGMTAFEIPDGDGMYINDYAVVLEEGEEYRRDDGKRFVEPVFTNLWNFGTPLIRYRGIEDLLHLQDTDWKDGPGTRRITEIMGRASEMIESPSGKRCSVCIVMSAHADLQGVRRFQYVQSDPSLLTFRYVAEEGADVSSIERDAERQIRTLFGADLRFVCQRVSALEKRTKTLKIPLLVKE